MARRSPHSLTERRDEARLYDAGHSESGEPVRDRAVEQDGVEAGGHDPLIGPAVPGTVPDDAVQVVQGSHAGKVRFDERHAEPDAVRVGVIEPGQHDTVVRVDALARPHAPDIVPGGDDPSAEDGNGVHDGRLGVTGAWFRRGGPRSRRFGKGCRRFPLRAFQLGSGLSLPGGHLAAARECGACWLVP